jgi:hypothetical protein
VHYVSYGTHGGEYPGVCRAAIITETHEGTEAVGLTVLNPEGIFLNRIVPFNDGDNGPKGGTWHWPERVEN